CGFSRDVGRRIKTLTGEQAAPTDKRQVEREMALKAYRWDYIKPAIMFVASFIVIAGILIADKEARLIPYALLVSGINVVIGLLVFWVCSLVYIDFEGTVPLTALRLLGIFGVVGVVGMAAQAFVPISILPWLLTTVVYLGLLSTMLELEMGDAIIVAVVNGIIRTAIYLFIISRL